MKIRADIIRTYQSLHTWTGITTGLLLFIAFFAGALTMFKGEINTWATPPVKQSLSLSHQQFDALIQQALAHNSGAAAEMLVTLDGEDAPLKWLDPDGLVHRAGVDASGTFWEQSMLETAPGELIDQLHRTAGIIGEVGHDHIGVYLLGLASILYFIALVSGLILLLPTLVRSFLALRAEKGAPRFWLDTHNLLGLTSLPFHLVIAATVVVFAFHDGFYGGLSLVYGDEPLFERPAPDKQEYQLEQLSSVAVLVAKGKELLPHYSVSRIQFRGLDGRRPVAILEMANEREIRVNPKGDRILLHPYNLKLIYETNPQGEEGVWGQMVRSIFALHFGSYGGDFTRWIYFALGLGGAMLFYSGNLLWLEKRRRRRGEQSRSSKVMAVLTIGVCLGSLTGVAAALALSKWLVALNWTPQTGYMTAYYSVFVGALLLCARLGPDRGALVLLRVFAGLCLALPLSSLLAVFMPQLGLWAAQSAEALAVEGMALLFALAALWAASMARRRMHAGGSLSAWGGKPQPA